MNRLRPPLVLVVLATTLLVGCPPWANPDDHEDKKDEIRNAEGPTDADGDGYAGLLDCDDEDADINPDADEVCDGVDNDCDGLEDDADSSLVGAPAWYADNDGDGFGDTLTEACEEPDGHVDVDGDCDDGDDAIHPDADERCDGIDNNCDGETDDAAAVDETIWYADSDGDGYGDASSPTIACDQPSDHVENSGDCDDGEPLAWTGADEVCDGVDNDCDALTDDEDNSLIDALTWYEDIDGDGYGQDDSHALACQQPTGFAAVGGDCDDGDAALNPDADDIGLNGVDEDCYGGDATTLDLGMATATHSGEDTGDQAGWAVAALEDQDGDGASELLIGAPGHDGDAGAVYLLMGPGTAHSALADATLIFDGEPSARLGEALAVLDLDGDGTNDVAMGAPDYDGGAGAVMLYAHSGDGAGQQTLLRGEGAGDHLGSTIAPIASLSDDSSGLLLGAPDGNFDSVADGAVFLLPVVAPGDADLVVTDQATADFHVGTTGARTGSGLIAGDLDGDGLDELIIGASGASFGGSPSGAVYLCSGPFSGSTDLEAGDCDEVFGGESGLYAAGSSLAIADTNGDGLNDLAVGAPSDDNGGSHAGAVYLFHGGVIGNVLSSADATFTGGAGTAAGSSAALADLNGDSTPDLVVGAPEDGATSGESGVHVLLGPLSGGYVPADVDALLSPEASGDDAGWSLDSHGDFDGDGTLDLLVGAPVGDGSASGQVYLLTGLAY